MTAGPSGTVADSSAQFAFSSVSGASFECKLDAGAWGACTSPYTITDLSAGAHTFEVRATVDGQTDPTPATRTWTVETDAPPQDNDTTAPELQSFALSPATIDTSTASKAITVTARITDAGVGNAGSGSASQVSFRSPSGQRVFAMLAGQASPVPPRTASTSTP